MAKSLELRLTGEEERLAKAREVIKALSEPLGYKVESLDMPQETDMPRETPGFFLESLSDCWRVNGVQYRNGIYQVDLAKALLDNGSAKTQDRWAEYSRQALENEQFHLGDFPLYFSLKRALFINKGNPAFRDGIEQAKEFIKEQMFQKWLMTLTRIRYAPNGKDTVIHDYGLPDPYEIQEDIIGPDEWVKDTSNPAVYKAILGSDNTAEIQDIYKWITGKDSHLWRSNTKPNESDERVVWFDADSSRADLDCNRDPQSSYATLGVRLRTPKA